MSCDGKVDIHPLNDLKKFSIRKFQDRSVKAGKVFIQTDNRHDIYIRYDCSFAINCDKVNISKLPRESDVLILMGHGEGAHLLFNQSVLCSSIDGKCNGDIDGCKRAIDDGYEWRYFKDISGKILVLLSCNSLNVAGETYPNGFSLVETALPNFDLILATPWALEYSERHLKAVLLTIYSSTSSISLLENINTLFGTEDLMNPFISIGNPNALLYSDCKVKLQYKKRDGSKLVLQSEDVDTLDGFTFINEHGYVNFAIDYNSDKVLPSYIVDNGEYNERNIARLKLLYENIREVKRIIYSDLAEILGFFSKSSSVTLLNDISGKVRETERILALQLQYSFYDSKVGNRVNYYEKLFRKLFVNNLREFIEEFIGENVIGDRISQSLISNRRQEKKLKLKMTCSACNCYLYSYKVSDLFFVLGELEVVECPVCDVKSIMTKDLEKRKIDILKNDKEIHIKIQKTKDCFPLLFIQFRDKSNKENRLTKVYFRGQREIDVLVPKEPLSLDQLSARVIEIGVDKIRYTQEVIKNV